MLTNKAGALGPTRVHAVFGSRCQPSTQFLSTQNGLQSRRKHIPCSCEAAKGFGKGSKRLETEHSQLLQKNQRKTGPDANWINIARMSEFPADRPTKPIVLKDKSTVMLYNIDGEVYCSDANSTAFKYPLTHGKIIQGESGPAVEVPLDGTVYDLETGKSNQQPQKLKVYPAQVDDEGTISVQFYKAPSPPTSS